MIWKERRQQVIREAARSPHLEEEEEQHENHVASVLVSPARIAGMRTHVRRAVTK